MHGFRWKSCLGRGNICGGDHTGRKSKRPNPPHGISPKILSLPVYRTPACCRHGHNTQITAPPRHVDNPVDRVKFGDAMLATSSSRNGYTVVA
jgi:hypothetical protein